MAIIYLADLMTGAIKSKIDTKNVTIWYSGVFFSVFFATGLNGAHIIIPLVLNR